MSTTANHTMIHRWNKSDGNMYETQPNSAMTIVDSNNNTIKYTIPNNLKFKVNKKFACGSTYYMDKLLRCIPQFYSKSDNDDKICSVISYKTVSLDHDAKDSEHILIYEF